MPKRISSLVFARFMAIEDYSEAINYYRGVFTLLFPCRRDVTTGRHRRKKNA